MTIRREAAAPPVVELLRAAHPLPSLAVTVFATAVSAAAGRSPSGCLLVAAAVATGQLSIGWCNDLLDRDRDRRAVRSDKPLVVGAVRPRLVATACVLALGCCVPLSLASGWRAGAAHLLGVAGGWAYNLGLKATLVSWLPYAASFGLLTAFVTLGLPGGSWPPPWALGAGSLLGVGAHFLNVVPDVEDDLAAGVRGLPQRIGARAAAVTGAALLCLATVLVVVGPGPPTPWWAWAGLAAAGVCAGSAGATGLRRTSSRVPFLLAVATAALTVTVLVARGSDLS